MSHAPRSQMGFFKKHDYTGTSLDSEIEKRLSVTKVVFFDVDGIFFSGRSFVMPVGEIAKERSLIDEQGLSFLRALGLRIAFVTGESSAFMRPMIHKLNNLPSVRAGKWPKITLAANKVGDEKLHFCQKFLSELSVADVGLHWDQVVYMGDDIGDFKVMKRVIDGHGVVVAPFQAEKIVKDVAHFITARCGGNGAIRDLANLMLEARGVDPTTLTLK